MDVYQKGYKDIKEWICVGCATELDPLKMDKYADVFNGLTKKGKSLKDLVTSVIKENLDEFMAGSKLCNACNNAYNEIEDLYANFRNAMDVARDKYILGQKALEADLAAVQQIHDLNTMLGALSLPIDDIVIKIFDNNVDSFNAILYGHQDFDLTPLRIYRGSILSPDIMPNPDTNDDNQMIITFELTTGAITRADNYYVKAQLEPTNMEDKDSGVVLYMIEAEFDAIKKVQADDRICISIDEFAKLDPIVIMGHRITWLQMILSNSLASEYRRQIPGNILF